MQRCRILPCVWQRLILAQRRALASVTVTATDDKILLAAQNVLKQKLEAVPVHSHAALAAITKELQYEYDASTPLFDHAAQHLMRNLSASC